ncbi:MAG: hypothetical protein JJU11_01230 [Candidatus Sumerlaeia bacterium]|nr:hypothetical protein [Candidatus Sumerlaeia bacterium]
MSSTTVPLDTSTKRPVHTSIVIGRHGERQLMDGWHERERDGRCDVSYRAGKEAATLELARLRGAKKIHLVLSGPIGLTSAPLDGRITINGRRHELPLAVDSWVLRVYPLETSRSQLSIRLELPNAPIPDQILKNGDARKLGWFLSAIWQE